MAFFCAKSIGTIFSASAVSASSTNFSLSTRSLGSYVSKIGKDDLVYGLQKNGALRSITNSCGGKTLVDIGNPYEAGFGSSWINFSKSVMTKTVNSGGKIYFDLTHMEDITGILNGTSKYSKSVTSQELIYLRDNWNEFKDSVVFMINQTVVKEPW